MTLEERIEDLTISTLAIKVLLIEIEELEGHLIENNRQLYDFSLPIHTLQTAAFMFENCEDLDLLAYNSNQVKEIFRQFNELEEYKEFIKPH